MSLFSPFKLNLKAAENELDAFENWLSHQTFLKENEIVSQIRTRQNMVGLLGASGNIPAPNLLKWQMDLKGAHIADLAMGNKSSRNFLMVEFEGAEEFSLFGKGGPKQNRYWSGQLEHGFGQVVDWACLLSQSQNDALLNQNFGCKPSRCSYIVVCGRSAGVGGVYEQQRLDYRRTHVRIEGIESLLLTYDEMVVAMRDNLDVAKSYSDH